MKRIMIVDDEFLVRIGIRSMIDWEAHGYTVVGEAANGQDAIEKLAAIHPHIILTDLLMEPVDGLELIRYCRQHHPHIRIIVLSNYNEFDKVKAAMKLGASDYLLKLTTSAAELLPILDEVSKGMEDIAENTSVEAYRLLNRNVSAIRQRLIRVMAHGGYTSSEDLLSELNLLDNQCNFVEPYYVLYLKIINFEFIRSFPEMQDLSTFSASFENIANEISQEVFPAQTFRYEAGDYIVVFNNMSDRDNPQFLKKVEEYYNRLASFIHRYLGVRLCAILSGKHLGVDSFASAMDACKKYISNCFLYEQQALLYSWQQTAGQQKLQIPEHLSMVDWKNALTFFNQELAADFVRQLIQFFYTTKENGTELFLYREKLFDLYRVWKKDSDAKGIDLDALCDNYGQPLYQIIVHYDLLSDVEKGFYEILQAYEQEYIKQGSKKLRKDIVRCISYVKQNLKEDLSVAMMAGYLHMSESYFSHLFKSEMGISFIEYVNQLRIENAKDLLDNTELRIGAIACEVGVPNANYFSILFKKITGLSPNEYRMGKKAE